MTKRASESILEAMGWHEVFIFYNVLAINNFLARTVQANKSSLSLLIGTVRPDKLLPCYHDERKV